MEGESTSEPKWQSFIISTDILNGVVFLTQSLEAGQDLLQKGHLPESQLMRSG